MVYLMWAIKNIALTCGWFWLAMHFDHWWIALFSVLTHSSLQAQTEHYRICDGCGRHSPHCDDHNTSIDEAIKAGWLRRKSEKGEWEDYCPDCQIKGRCR